MDRPEIHAKHGSDSTLNLSNIFPRELHPTRTRHNSVLLLKRFNSSQGTIDYVDTQRNLDINVQGITLTVDGPLDTWNHKANLRIDAGSFTFNSSETLIDKFEVDFRILATRSQLDRLQLDFGHSKLDVTGQFPHRSTGKPWGIGLDLYRLDVADVERFFGEGTELEGIVKGRITANGTDSGFAAALSVEMPTFSMTQAENDRQIALTDLKIDAGFNLYPTPTFTLKTFSAQVADGTLTGGGSIGLQNGLEGDVIMQLQQLTAHPLFMRDSGMLQICNSYRCCQCLFNSRNTSRTAQDTSQGTLLSTETVRTSQLSNSIAQ